LLLKTNFIATFLFLITLAFVAKVNSIKVKKGDAHVGGQVNAAATADLSHEMDAAIHALVPIYRKAHRIANNVFDEVANGQNSVSVQAFTDYVAKLGFPQSTVDAAIHPDADNHMQIQFDLNKDGQVDKNEAEVAIKNLLGLAAANILEGKFNVNLVAQGKHHDEIVDMLNVSAGALKAAAQRFEKIYQQLDTDKDGNISHDEFVNGLKPYFPDVDLEGMFKDADVNHDNKLSHDEGMELFGSVGLRLAQQEYDQEHDGHEHIHDEQHGHHNKDDEVQTRRIRPESN